MLTFNTTPIFEWCSRKNRIVIDYPEDKLVLVALRHNNSGVYTRYDMLSYIGRTYKVPVVEQYYLEGNTGPRSVVINVSDYIRHGRALEDQEGFVIRFGNGHMFKIKGDWYCQIHKCKESLSQEKNLIELIINEKLDDLKPHLLPDDLERVNDFEHNFWVGFYHSLDMIYERLIYYKEITKGDRKAFALRSSEANLHPIKRNIMFSVWDGKKDMCSVMLDIIRKNCGSQTKVDAIRGLWCNVKWRY